MWMHTQYAVTQGVTTVKCDQCNVCREATLTIINELNTVLRIVLHDTLLEACPQEGYDFSLEGFRALNLPGFTGKAVPLAMGTEEKTVCKGIRCRPRCYRRNKGQ